MDIAIKGTSAEELVEFLVNINAELLKEGDKVTVHFPDGHIVGYGYCKKRKFVDPKFVLKPEILEEI